MERTPVMPAETTERAPVELPWRVLDGLGLALRLPPDDSSAAAARHSVGGLAAALGAAGGLVADVRLALTEICGALVQSVPAGIRDDLEVDVRLDGDRLEARVLHRRACLPAAAGHPLSLSLLAALTDAVRVRRPPEGGVEVIVSFVLREPRGR